MRKFVALLLVLLLALPTFAVADAPDLSSLTEAELYQLIDSARLELTRFNPIVAKGTVLYEDECVRITYTGGMSLSSYDSLLIPVVAENLTDKNIMIGFENCSCNGWEIYLDGFSISAGKKTRNEFEIFKVSEKIGVTDVAEVQDIEGELYYFDTDTYTRIKEDLPVTWLFGK